MNRILLISILSLGLFAVLALPTFSFAGEALVPCNGVKGAINNPAPGVAAEECKFEHLIEMVNRIITFLLLKIAAPLATISFVWAGILYVTAAGDSSKISKAHGIFKNVLIGLILAFGAFLIVTAITKSLEVDKDIQNLIIKP
jgi:hypothetical protein